MDQQAKVDDALDLSIPDSSYNAIELPWPKTNIDQYKHILQPIISKEEKKIRDELEMDIETGLEQEIKDGIYHLALRLHQLYQHQKERSAREALEMGDQGKRVLEVNISIRLEGGTKIEIKETKMEVPEEDRPRTSARFVSSQGHRVCDTKKFDWEKTLRSSSCHTMDTNKKKQIRSNELKPSSNNDQFSNGIENIRTNLTSASGKQKENARIDNYKALELGWKW